MDTFPIMHLRAAVQNHLSRLGYRRRRQRQSLPPFIRKADGRRDELAEKLVQRRRGGGGGAAIRATAEIVSARVRLPLL